MASLIDARTHEAADLTAPVCIVGGGPVGLAVSISLTRAGIDHIVIESGGTEPGDAQHLAGGKITGRPYAHPFGPLHADLSGTRVRALGGTTHVWGGWSKPLRPIDFEKRAYVPYSGWPITHSELMRWIPDAARTLHLADAWAATDVGDPQPYVTPDLGFFDFEGFRISPVKGDHLETNKGSYFAYNKNRIGARILLHLSARRLVFDESGAVTSLSCTSASGETVSVQARAFVLACGGIENARFLLLNKRLGNSPLHAHQAVGRFFMEHPHVEIGHLHGFEPLPEEFYGIGIESGETLAWRFFLKEDIQRRTGLLPPMVVLHSPEPGAKTSKVKVMSEQVPNPSSRVSISETKRDRLGDPMARLHIDFNAWEYESIYRAGVLFGREAGLQGVGRLQLDIVPPERIDDFDTQMYRGGHHHMGTTRMGASRENAVVDPDCRVFDTKNLYVAGTSVFPTGSCVNPTMNAVALAFRLGEHLKGRLGT